MNAGLSPSIFTIEVDRNPVLAYKPKKHSEIQQDIADEHIRNQLSALSLPANLSVTIIRSSAFG
jgi:hypothetical protein